VYVEFYPDSVLSCQGRMVAGARQGAWHYYNPDGSPSANLFFVDGKLNGTQNYYTKKGQHYRQNKMRDGLLTGYTFYGPTGEILGSGELEKGTGTVSWNYPNGQLAYKVEVKSGQYHGKIELFYPNGKIRQRGEYAFDESSGNWK